MNPHREPEESEPQAPDALVKALRGLRQSQVLVPPSVDDAILLAARRRLGRVPQRKVVWLFPLLRWAAAAACLVAVFWIAVIVAGSRSGTSFARDDLNRDGRVDILDAFTLALRIEQGKAADPAWDFNGDGRIDRLDVDALAARAVSLPHPSGPARAESSPRARPALPGNAAAGRSSLPNV